MCASFSCSLLMYIFFGYAVHIYVVHMLREYAGVYQLTHIYSRVYMLAYVCACAVL